MTPMRRSAARPWPPRVLAAALGLLLVVVGCHDSSDREPVDQARTTQGYVGSDRCELCHGPYVPAVFHPTYGDDWRASAHGKTVDVQPSEATIVADRDDDGTSDFRDGLDLGTLPEWLAFTRAGGAAGDLAPLLGFDAATGEYTMTIGTRTFVVGEILGIGRSQQAYLTTMGSSWYVLPAVWQVAARTWTPLLPEQWYLWDDTDGNGVIDDTETVTGLVYPTSADTPVTAGRTTDAWDRQCAGCHATGFDAVTRTVDGEFVAEVDERGVGCEACHGPGALHSNNLGGQDLADRAIVNPSNLPASEHRDLCMSCHSRGTSVGQVDAVHLEYPWGPDDTPFVPGETLADSFTLGIDPDERVHELQGNETHQGFTGSAYGVWSHDCQDCHSAHDTTNLSLVRMTVPTPSSGDRDVIFTARSGPLGSGGLMGDASDGVFTDICEVCHTRTEYFRNDASTPDTGHFNGDACSDCHLHSRGFLKPESAGGVDCDLCHGYLFSTMSMVTADYRHLLGDAGTAYPTDTTQPRCLTCHVDHDLFIPDGGSKGRGANLRTDIAVVPDDSGGFAASDFLAAGNGGICLSCHTDGQLKSYARPDGSTETPPIPHAGAVVDQVAAYDAGMHGGSYQVPSEFRGSGADTFMANCSKCHNDDLDPKSGVGGQTGTLPFGLHTSTRSRLLSPLGYAGNANPLEEEFCYRCHSRVGDPIGGTRKPAAGRDWYDVAAMTDRAEDLWTTLGKVSRHAVEATSGVHATVEGLSWNWNPAGARHVECEDCHNLHATGPARAFDTSGLFAQPLTPTNLADATPLQSVWGVDVPAWPAAWTTPDPATDYARVEASTYGWQVCLKCHSGYAYGGTPPINQTDQALEFNPNNASYHAVVGASRTTYPPNSSFVSPWLKTSPMDCSDCHTNDAKAGAQGPHGSTHDVILAGPFDGLTGERGTEDHLCFKCHSYDVYGRDGSAPGSATGFADGNRNLHRFHTTKRHWREPRGSTCWDCHAAVPHGWHRRALLVVRGDPYPYDNGSAALDAADIPSWPASGNWEEDSCDNSPCH